MIRTVVVDGVVETGWTRISSPGAPEGSGSGTT